MKSWVDIRAFPKLLSESHDSQRINRAINYACAQGIYTVVLPSGTYTLDAPIMVKGKVKITGNGINNTTLKAMTNIHSILEFDTSGTLTENAGIEISHLFLDCNNKADYGIFNNGSIREHLISRVQISRALKAGIKNLTVFSCTFEKCYILNCPTGIDFSGAANDLTILDNHIIGARIGINIESTLNNSSSGNVLLGNNISDSGTGIRFYNEGSALSLMTVIGNYMESNGVNVVCISSPSPDVTLQHSINLISNKFLVKSSSEYNIDLQRGRMRNVNITGNWFGGGSVAYIKTPPNEYFRNSTIASNYKNDKFPLATSFGGYDSYIEDQGFIYSDVKFMGRLGIGTSQNSTSLGSVVKKIPVWDNGVIIGYLPLYDTIS